MGFRLTERRDTERRYLLERKRRLLAAVNLTEDELTQRHNRGELTVYELDAWRTLEQTNVWLALNDNTWLGSVSA